MNVFSWGKTMGMLLRIISGKVGTFPIVPLVYRVACAKNVYKSKAFKRTFHPYYTGFTHVDVP